MRLAEISKRSSVSKAYSVPPLRGSDLTEFNESHPRDEGGRFTVVGAPAEVDPRSQRKARRGRRLRRAVRASQASQLSTSAPVKEQQAPPPVGLERLLQLRNNPRVSVRRNDPRVKSQPKADEGKREKIDLNDKANLSPETEGNPIDSTGYVFVEPDQAMEVLAAKSFVVDAANRRWGTQLTVFDANSVEEYVRDNDVSGKVLLQINRRFHANETTVQPGGVGLSPSQYVAPDLSVNESLDRNTPTHQFANTDVRPPVIQVNAYTPGEAALYLTDYPNINKAMAVETWDDDAHPRDWDSGRFVSTKVSRGTPTPPSVDPRVARSGRRKRRVRRAIAAREASDIRVQVREEPGETPVRERLLVERRNERIGLHQRRDARASALRVDPRVLPKDEPEAQRQPPERPRGPAWAGVRPTAPVRGDLPEDIRVPRDRRAINRIPLGEEEDILRGWFDDDGHPRFSADMRMRDVPPPLQRAFRVWRRTHPRKPPQAPS